MIEENIDEAAILINEVSVQIANKNICVTSNHIKKGISCENPLFLLKQTNQYPQLLKAPEDVSLASLVASKSFSKFSIISADAFSRVVFTFISTGVVTRVEPSSKVTKY